MKTSQEQILKALSGLIPEDAQEKVSSAISTFIENATEELEKQYNGELEKTFKQVQEEKAGDEKVAFEGYAQAWDMITDLRNRLESQKEEFDKVLDEEFANAYSMLEEERAKNDTLEVDLYDEFDKRLADIKEYLVDKLDEFLQVQGQKYYEQAKRDVVNDPALAEHKVAFEKILEVAANYLSDEDYAYSTNSKVKNTEKNLEETKAQMRILEAKNMRLSKEKDTLNEVVRQVREAQELLTESANKNEKKARTEKARIVEGRGKPVINSKREVLLGEQQDVAETVDDQDDDGVLTESIDTWTHLAGLTTDVNGNTKLVKRAK